MSETISRAETIYNDTLERIGKERDFYKKHVDSGSFGKESIFKIVLEATERIDREYDIGNITEENRNELIRKLQLETSKSISRRKINGENTVTDLYDLEAEI